MQVPGHNQIAHNFAKGILIDACVLMDAFLEFREKHQCAIQLFKLLRAKGISVHVPSHIFFECTTAVLIHFKRDRELLDAHPVNVGVPDLGLEVISLSLAYVEELLDGLLNGPLPDLKSQDLIYFCIARNQQFTLITEDRKLLNIAKRGGIDSFDIAGALAVLEG